MHLIQLYHPKFGRRVGVISEPDIILLNEKVTSSYDLFLDIINNGTSAPNQIRSLQTQNSLNYEEAYTGTGQWTILPPIDCSVDPMKCMLSGTGLTHKASALNRQKMHDNQEQGQLSDSMKMYLWGEAGGKPEPGKIGVQPEWFYKGNGHNLKGHGQSLIVPDYGDDGGEEPEIAGVYLISDKGVPWRIGFTQGNEFSDHVMEKKNYLYLAPSKIRPCSIGPELVLENDFALLPGTVSIVRNGSVIWSTSVQSGEEVMAHTLANLEYHHFKYDQHRMPGQLHIHFFGTGAFSFGANVLLQHGDEMQVHFEKMGRPLINVVQIEDRPNKMPEIKSFRF